MLRNIFMKNFLSLILESKKIFLLIYYSLMQLTLEGYDENFQGCIILKLLS